VVMRYAGRVIGPKYEHVQEQAPDLTAPIEAAIKGRRRISSPRQGFGQRDLYEKDRLEIGHRQGPRLIEH